jgi:hypothetical protein
MHILVEGFDGTGKSTLCRLLSTATDWPVTHQSCYRPDSPEEYALACSKALASTELPDLISDRWPTVTNYCYLPAGLGGDLVTLVSSLRDARVDRIIHCDVDSLEDLRIVPRPCDARDAEQTRCVRAIAARVVAAYRDLMLALRGQGFDVRRYTMINRGNLL